MAEKTKKKAEKRDPHYSFSGLECYTQCGYRYGLQYVAGHYIDQHSCAMDFGTLVHYIYELEGKAFMEGKKPDYAELEKIFRSIDRNAGRDSVHGIEALARMYPDDFASRENKDGLSFADKSLIFLGTSENRGSIASLERYLDAHPTQKVVGVEVEFWAKYKKVWLRGFIDRLLFDEETKEYVIEDIKTKGHEFSSAELKTAQQQFVIYALAVSQMKGLKDYPTQFDYDLPFVSDPAIGAFGYRQSVGGYPMFMNAGLRTIDGQLAGIDAQDFTPHPSPLCYWCPFCDNSPMQPAEGKHLCPYFSLWDPEHKTWAVKVENEWKGIAEHPMVLAKYQEACGMKGKAKDDFEFEF